MRRTLGRAAGYAVLLLNLVMTGFPVIWMVLSSFKSNSEYFANPWGLPRVWRIDNFVEAWRRGIQSYLLNSVMITSAAVATSIIAGGLVAFYLARRPFRGSKALLGLFILGMMVPVQSTMIPLFMIINGLGMYNTFLALYMPYAAFALPLIIFLLYGFFLQVPNELEEAAVIDGCGIFRIFGSVFLPLARPLTVTAAILSTISTWNEFSLALVLVSKESLKTLPIGLLSFKGMFSVDYATMSAALVFASAPIVILYLAMSERVTEGMIAGAVKG